MRKEQKSVFRELALGLSIVGAVGTVLVFYTVVREYGFVASDFRSFDALQSTVPEIFDHVVLPVLLMAVPMAGAGLWVMRRSFAPLRLATNRIEASRGHERGYRIDRLSLPLEAQPFVDAINALLERLDTAAEQQEAFAADVAHELRGPLTVLSLELDQLDHPKASQLKVDVVAMRRLIDQLMLLAQIDASKAAHVAPERILLADIGTQIVSQFAPIVISASKLIELDVQRDAGSVLGQRDAIAAALRNLVENAIRVTPAGGLIRVIVGPGNVIRVRDEGPGLSPASLSKLVHRHARADHASRDGAGLGLSIVDRIMLAHGGSLRTDAEAKELVLEFS